MVDSYIKKMLDERYKIVLNRLEEYKDCIERIVEALREKETIDGEQLREIIVSFEEEKGIKSTKRPLEEKDEK